MANIDFTRVKAQVSDYIGAEAIVPKLQEGTKLWRKGAPNYAANGTQFSQEFYRNFKPTGQTYAEYIDSKTTPGGIVPVGVSKYPSGNSFLLTYGQIQETDRVFDNQRLNETDLVSVVEGGASELSDTIIRQFGDQVIVTWSNFAYREYENISKAGSTDWGAGTGPKLFTYFDTIKELTTSDTTGETVYNEMGDIVEGYKGIPSSLNTVDYKIMENDLRFIAAPSLTTLLRRSKQASTIGIVELWEGGSSSITKGSVHGVEYYEDPYIQETNLDAILLTFVKGSMVTQVSLTNFSGLTINDPADIHEIVGGRYKFDANAVAPGYMHTSIVEGGSTSTWAAPVIDYLPTVKSPGQVPAPIITVNKVAKSNSKDSK